MLWLTPDARNLQSLSYEYTGVEPEAARFGAGGTWHFHAMPNGATFIDRWLIRLPTLVPDNTAMRGQTVAIRSGRGVDAAVSGRQPLPMKVAQSSEQGGMVLRAQWSDSVSWAFELPTVSGVVREVGTHRPLTGVSVAFRGTSIGGITDSAGVFILPGVLEGHYLLSAADTVVVSRARARIVTTPIVVRAAANVPLVVELPPRLNGDERGCPGGQIPAQSAALFGRLDPAPGLTQDLAVQATWQSTDSKVMLGGSASALRDERTVEVDQDGHFVICGLPRTYVHLSLRANGRVLSDSTITIPKLSEVVDVVLSARPRP